MNKLLFISIIFFNSIVFSQEFAAENSDTTFPYFLGTFKELGKQIDDIFNDPNFNNANWGVVIQSLETGEFIYKRNEEKLFMPASNMKLFTTAAGLFLLTPEYQFKTHLYINGEIDGTVLYGDLIVRGTGDPAISGRFYNGDILKVFNDWADSLISFGIDEIYGNIIGDDNAFDNLLLGSGWAWDYETYWYAAPISAISYNDNCIDITITPTMSGDKSKITLAPDTRYVTIVNNILTGPEDSVEDISFYRERGTNVITLNGTKPEKSDARKIFVTVNNPTQYAMVVLKEVLERKGIVIRGYAADIDDIDIEIDYLNLTYLMTHHSTQLNNIVRVINKSSQNLFSELILKAIGYEIFGYGTIENGVRAAKEIYAEMGINPENLIMADGSGLSRLNLVTPKQLTTLLGYIYKSDLFVPFFNSLPIAGIDGSLGTRMKNTRAENNARAKTGYIGGVRSLSGYVYTGDYEPIAFSMIVNNFTVPLKLADNIQDLVCQRLANFKRIQ